MRTLKSVVGGIVREAALHLDMLRRGGGDPRVLFFPSQGLDDGAARLRAYAIADELRALGWRAVTCPKHLGLAARRRLVKRLKPEVIVMQTTRHILNRPHLFPGVPVVIDLDDADYANPESATPLVRALRECSGVIAGSQAVARVCRQYNDRVTVIWTGTPPSESGGPPQSEREPIVTWAASSLIGSPKEAAFVRQVLDLLVARGARFRFRMYSDDGSAEYRAFVRQVVPAGVEVETLPYLFYPEFLASLDAVAVGLAPLVDIAGFSGGKSFGKVLAYLDRNVPIVTHPVVDHPLFFESGRNGLMLTSANDWADAIVRLLGDAEARQAMASAARADMLRRLTAQAAAGYVDGFLKDVIADSATKPATMRAPRTAT